MNSLKRIAGLTLIALIALTLNGCNKDDTTPPDITVLGNNPFNLEVLTTYTDAGATADDDEDGDITSSIIVDNNVNNKIPGSYSVFYTATDAAGNEGSATRTVDVFATTAALAKNYSVVDTCTSGGVPAVFTYNQTITAVNSTTIQFNKFGDYSGNTSITATLNANGTITIPTQTGQNIGGLVEDHEFAGNGVWTTTGLMITYTDKNLSAGNAIANCKAYYTR